MEKKSNSLILALAFGAIALSACAGGKGSDGASSTPPGPSPVTSESESSEPLPDITIPEGSFSYLKGTFYGGGGALSISEKSVTITGDTDLDLKPTSVGTYALKNEADEDAVDENVVAIYFSAAYNNGVDYCIYADVVNDGYVHLAKKDGDAYSTIFTYQPDISKYAGVFSYDGSGSEYSVYFILDPNFDFERNAYPWGSCYVYSSSWTAEQSYYALARVRLDSEDKAYYSIEFFDSDDYGWGESQLLLTETGLKLYNTTYEYSEYFADAGAFNKLSLFDGDTKASIQTAVDVSNKAITFGDKQGTYEVAYDDEGMYLNAAFGSESAKLRLRDLHLIYESGDSKKVYPVDSTSALVGTFTDKANTVSFSVDENTSATTLKWNGTEVEHTYVVENNRKSVAFTVNGINYILSPDKDESSVRLSIEGSVNYYINAERYDALYKDSFVAHDKENDFVIWINNDFTYSMGSESGKATYSYWHGDKRPSLTLTNAAGASRTLSLEQEDIGLYSISDSSKKVWLYSQATLSKVFGAYSSDGEDEFVIDANSITYEGVHYDYEFAPAFQSGLGYYYFGVSCAKFDLMSNLNGCIYNKSISFVNKDIFSKIVGTYSLYGKYGIENIKFTEDRKLFLDTENSAGDGLDKDVPYTYQIITSNGGDGLAVLGFLYKGYTIFIYIYEDHATITGLDYYKQAITETWGVYVDEASSSILYANGGDLYLNGTKLTINSKSEMDSGMVYDTNEGLVAFNVSDDGASVSVISSSGATTLSRKYAFGDYSKFIGEYTANSKTIKFEATTTSYKASIDGTAVELSSLTFVLKDGKVAIKIPNLFDSYYLIMDDATNTVSCEYGGSSLPPIPSLSSI